MKEKDPLFFQRHETLTRVNLMTQSFEVGSLTSFGTDLVAWTSPKTSLSVFFPPVSHSYPVCVALDLFFTKQIGLQI